MKIKEALLKIADWMLGWYVWRGIKKWARSRNPFGERSLYLGIGDVGENMIAGIIGVIVAKAVYDVTQEMLLDIWVKEYPFLKLLPPQIRKWILGLFPKTRQRIYNTVMHQSA